MERNNILKKTKVISKNIIETMKLLLRYEKKYIFLSLFLNISVSTLPFISIIISQKMLNMLQIGGEIIIDAPLPDPRSLSNIADGDGLYAALPQQLLERV